MRIWHVSYDDGDEEEMDEHELKRCVLKAKSGGKATPATGRKRRAPVQDTAAAEEEEGAEEQHVAEAGGAGAGQLAGEDSDSEVSEAQERRLVDEVAARAGRLVRAQGRAPQCWGRQHATPPLGARECRAVTFTASPTPASCPSSAQKLSCAAPPRALSAR